MLSKIDIEKYFTAEKQESLVFIVLGIAAIIVAAILLFSVKNSFNKGFSIPLIVIAIVQIVVGYTVYKRSDNDRISVVYNLEMNPENIAKKELPRMQKVNKNFIIYKWIEIVLIAVSIFLFIKFKPAPEVLSSSFWFGFAIALSIQSSIMLVADLIAAKRGNFYEQLLTSWVKNNK